MSADPRAVIVTGASSGIGAATAVRFAQAGWLVYAAARSSTGLAKLAATAGRRIVPVVADLRVPAAVDDLVQRAAGETGRLNAIVSNAGVMTRGDIREMSNADIDAMVTLNLLTAINLSRAALPSLHQHASATGYADIVLVGSLSGRRPLGGAAVYAASKAGVQAYAEALRQELVGTGIRVSLLEPGSVDTAFAHTATHGTTHPDFEGFERLTPDDIAEIVEFIVSRPARVAINATVVRPAGQRI